MNEKLIKIGAIIATRGLNGEVKVFPTTDFVEDRYYVGAKMMLSLKNEVKLLVTIASINNVKNILAIKFKEINVIEEAEKYLRYDVVIKRSQAKLPKGFVFDDELVDLDVVTTDGIYVGKVKEVLTYTSQKTLRVGRENLSDVLVPIVSEFVIETDLDKKQITIQVIDGMLWKLQF